MSHHCVFGVQLHRRALCCGRTRARQTRYHPFAVGFRLKAREPAAAPRSGGRTTVIRSEDASADHLGIVDPHLDGVYVCETGACGTGVRDCPSDAS